MILSPRAMFIRVIVAVVNDDGNEFLFDRVAGSVARCMTSQNTQTRTRLVTA